MPNHRKISLRAPLIYLLIGLILGLILAKETEPNRQLILGLSFLLAIGCLWLAWIDKWEKLWSIAYILAATLCFLAYGLIRLPPVPHEASLSLPLREVTLSIEVEHIMNPKDGYGRVTGIGTVLESTVTSRLSKGQRIYFQIGDPASGSITRGLKLRATGVLKPIRKLQGNQDSFAAYLRDADIHYRFGRVSKLDILESASLFYTFCREMNQRFQNDLRRGAPNSSQVDNIYVAMLLGWKEDLTEAQAERFRLSGTMHLFAISGLHIGVIATVIAQFLLLIRIPRNIGPLIGLPLLYLYVEITGASPSAMRAFLMATFFWTSFAINRQRSPLQALVGSALFVLIIDPRQLWSVGFQLSYTVVLSILLFGLPLYDWLQSQIQPFKWLPQESWTWREKGTSWTIEKLSLLFAISFAAWVGTTPLSASLFGFVSPGAIFLNMLLVNLAALVISGGVISLITALIGAPGICAFLNHSAWLSISLMDTLIIIGLKIPWIYIPSGDFPLWLSYLSLFVFFGFLFKCNASKNLLGNKFQPILLAPLIVLMPVAVGTLLSN
ncbi:MAG: ComEC/Rec2 family competence protein [Verrucomicrobiota bacterium]